MIESFNVLYTGKNDLIDIQPRVASHDPERIFVQVFSGVLDQPLIHGLISEFNELFPGVSMIGTSTAGEIMNAESLEQTVVINFTLFAHSRVRSVLVTRNDDLTAAGRQIGDVLDQDDVKAAVVFGCGLKAGKTINGEPLLRAIQSELPGVVIAGGQAGDNGAGETTFVFTGQGITESGVAAASLAGEKLAVNNTYNLSWVPIGKLLTITKADGPRVYAIDKQSPYEIYCHYLGQEVADNLPLSAADFPLIIERDGIPMAIHATGVNRDGSFEYIHNFHAGEQLRFGFCHAGLLALNAEETFKEIVRHGAQAVFLYSCVSRKWVLGADINVELSSVAGHPASAGFYAYGEYFYRREKAKAYFFSQTMTVLSLAEEGPDRPNRPEQRPAEPFTDEESRHFRTLRVLHRLVDTSTREIESMSAELARLAHKDSLTGLANRRRFDEMLLREIRRLTRSAGFLSLILLDVDFFKQFNDTYGHIAGDDCLRGMAQILREVCRRPSDIVCRYGGEEFACIVPMADHETALHLAESVRRGVESLKIEHALSRVSDVVTVSRGVVTIRSENQIRSPQDIVEACDKLLYQAKQQGRNRIAGKDLSV